jgi:CheY-like chemotaxis protein
MQSTGALQMISDVNIQDRRWPLIAMTDNGDLPSREGASDRQSSSLEGRSILVVEDESMIALLIVDALEEAGASIVGPCFTLAECLRMAQSEEVHAAILDVDLAGQDVFPAAEELRRRGIPFVFHTAHGERSEIQSQFGDVPVCRKPVRMDQLLETIARIAGPASTN